jgi:hypothetical protein
VPATIIGLTCSEKTANLVGRTTSPLPRLAYAKPACCQTTGQGSRRFALMLA